MLRLVFRFFGSLFLAIAFAALIVDGTRSIAAGTPAILPLGRTLSALFPDLFVKLQTEIATYAPLLWDPVLVTILLLPAWLVAGFLGLGLMSLARKPRAQIGYARR